MRYNWTPPKATEGETWAFYDHPRKGRDGLLLKGKVMMVITHYDRNGKAYHIFGMQVPGYARRRAVGEDSLRSCEEMGKVPA